jgi:hypothetical protein
MKLIPFRPYEVKGMPMYFWRYRDDDTPEFYYHAGYGATLHTIYYWNKDLKKEDIKPGPMICNKQVNDQQQNAYAVRTAHG